MALDLGLFPIALLLLVLPLPLMYSLMRKRIGLRAVLGMCACCVLVVLLYPLVFFLSDIFGILGYAAGKLGLFVFLPLVTLVYLERRRLRGVLVGVGVRWRNAPRSLALGGLAAVVTIAVTFLVTAAQPIDMFVSIVLFLEAFTEEFLFRGVLLIYLATKTDAWVAYVTSIVGFVLVHPQNFESWFLVSTVVQAILLAIVADRTQNLAGSWVAHGLNRTIPQVLRLLLGS